MRMDNEMTRGSVGTGRKETARVNKVAPGGSDSRTDVARHTAGMRRCRIAEHEGSVGRQVIYRRDAGMWRGRRSWCSSDPTASTRGRDAQTPHEGRGRGSGVTEHEGAGEE
jgi:hypothetical protein